MKKKKMKKNEKNNANKIQSYDLKPSDRVISEPYYIMKGSFVYSSEKKDEQRR